MKFCKVFLFFYLIAFSIILISCSAEKYFYKDNSNYHLTTKNADWILSFPIGDYSLNDQFDGEQSDNYLFSDTQKKFILAIEIDKNVQCNNTLSCREEFIKNPTGAPFLSLANKINYFELGEAALVEYYVSKYENEQINQNNITAVYFRNGFVIKVNISKPSFQNSERQQMIDLIKSISFTNKH